MIRTNDSIQYGILIDALATAKTVLPANDKEEAEEKPTAGAKGMMRMTNLLQF